ncbi:PREDICTED: LOW QUALITY PROTEIN: NKG2D ligand 2-like [Myotis brandtii]|uniref:LOW QUALITY PROTEIN: NKG2D ligand 2-like n=1 Tax=Myotis brandtii TaxID=109478 RepID=UPI0007041223|nr:PREDICTED: LOW QUALITY PROTEIN: NKG2D ligand 2-like [Myotis brandtii]
MERSVGFSPVFLLLLLLWEPAALLCSLSLGYKFTVTPNGQPWCEIQGQVNGNTFLHYTCSSQKVKLISVLEMNATQAWNQQRDALNYVMEELKKILLDIKAERIATSDPLSLQGGMLCKQESSGCTSASWEFALDGQISLHFDSKNGNWTVLHGEGRLLNKTLASDRAMTDLLIRTSPGDCRKWLKQVLCPQMKLSTKAASTTATALSTASKRITSLLPVILTCWVIAGIVGWSLYSNRLPMLPRRP